MAFGDKHYPAGTVLPADAVVLGETVVDLFPEDGAGLEDAPRFSRHLGGAAANLAVALQRQGVRAALCARVGPDPFGRFLLARLRDEGVAIDGVAAHRSARTGVVFLCPWGPAPVLAYRQQAADLLIAPADLQPAQITRGRVLCLGAATLVHEPARSATWRALELARGAGMLVCADLNFRPHQWPDAREAPPLLRRLMAGSDLVKLSAGELLPLCGTESIEAAAARVRELGAAVVAITQGEGGCFLAAAPGTAYLAGEAVRVADPTGAGDAFTAGLLCGVLRELGPRQAGPARARLDQLGLPPLKAAAALGNHLGALACTAIGATTAVPRVSAAG